VVCDVIDPIMTSIVQQLFSLENYWIINEISADGKY
jgi:hypothetical protein